VEPAIELALRVTAHLWILRHVFPEKHNVADLPADWVEQIKAFAAQDFALSRQIADLAPDPREGGGRTSGMTSFLQALVPEPMSAPRCPRSDVRPSLSAKREEAIERFCAHLLELSVEDREPATRGRFARETLKFRGIRAEAGTEADTVEDVSRDEVIDSLAGKLLLDSVLMVHVSQTLGYVPELAKQSSALEGNQWTDPTVLTDLADKAEKPIPFSLVHREELKEIGRSRHRRFTDFFESTLGPNAARKTGLRSGHGRTGALRRGNPKRHLRPWCAAIDRRQPPALLCRLSFDCFRRRIYWLLDSCLDKAPGLDSICPGLPARAGERVCRVKRQRGAR
jgi:hypothetical protein